MDKPKTAKEVFQILRDFFQNDSIGPEEKEKAWDVLTALRGPDVNTVKPGGAPSEIIKSSTTCIIRGALLGSFADVPATIHLDTPDFVRIRQLWRHDGAEHFANHVVRAFRALGLEWDVFNPFGNGGIKL